MPRTIKIENNFCVFFNDFPMFEDLNIVYSPVIHSNLQRDFHSKRFEYLKKIIPNITFDSKTYQNIEKVYAWDSYDEIKRDVSKITSKQNRLLTEVPFEIPNGFSSFKNKIVKCLPCFYSDAVTPIDDEIKTHLDNYFNNSEAVLSYFETRNQMTGENYSTQMSAFLSSGHLDVKYLYNRIKEFESNHYSNKSTEWIIYELLWREFFYWHYQKVGTLFFSYNGIKGKKDFSPYKHYKFDELFELKAHPFFYAALNELKQTGFLSNRSRQMFASIWINDLKLDWRSGASLFEYNLIDYDVFSNWGNWMYLAGVGVDPRGKRYFDIDKQLKTYDPQKLYLKTWN